MALLQVCVGDLVDAEPPRPWDFTAVRAGGQGRQQVIADGGQEQGPVLFRDKPPRRSQPRPRSWGAIGDTDPGRVATPGKGYACGWNNGTLNSPLIYRRKHRQSGASARARTARRDVPELARRRATRRRSI